MFWWKEGKQDHAISLRMASGKRLCRISLAITLTVTAYALYAIFSGTSGFLPLWIYLGVMAAGFSLHHLGMRRIIAS